MSGARRAGRREAPAAALMILLHDLAVAHPQTPREARGDVLVVGDEHQRRPLRGEAVEQLDHRRPGLGVEVAGRLVGEDQGRALGERTRDRHPLTLTARQRARAVVEPMSEADALQRLARDPAPRPQRHAGVEHPGGDVVDGAERVLQMERLEHEPDAVRSQAGERPIARAADIEPGDPHRSRGRPLERADDREQRRLPRAGRSDHRDLLAAADLDRHVAQGVHAPGVLLADAVEPRARRRRLRRGAHPWESVIFRPGCSPAPDTCT